MSELANVRAELEALHRKLLAGHPDQRGIQQAIDDWLLAEAEFLRRDGGC